MNLPLNNEVTNHSTCWLITRKDGIQIGLTEGQVDVVIDGQLYHACPGIERSALNTGQGFKADQMEVDVLLTSDLLREEDIRKGLYDGATVLVFLVDYENPKDGKLSLLKGTLGTITFSGGLFKAELVSLAQKLESKIGQHFSPGCRASFGDQRCRIDVEAWTHVTEISKVICQDVFQIKSYMSSAPLKGGVIQWLSDKNQGVIRDIVAYDKESRTLKIFEALPYDIGKGDKIKLTPGCDKSITMCGTLYKNALNFRGEPFVTTPRNINRI